MYGFNVNDFLEETLMYSEETASPPPVGRFYKGNCHIFAMAPVGSNRVAKRALVTTLYSQAGKCRVPIIVYPREIAPEMETTAPGGKKVMGCPRKIDLDGTRILRTFEYTTVVESVVELIITVKERLDYVSKLYESVIKLNDFATSPEAEG